MSNAFIFLYNDWSSVLRFGAVQERCSLFSPLLPNWIPVEAIEIILS
jgi:hypothetical protein